MRGRARQGGAAGLGVHGEESGGKINRSRWQEAEGFSGVWVRKRRIKNDSADGHKRSRFGAGGYQAFR